MQVLSFSCCDLHGYSETQAEKGPKIAPMSCAGTLLDCCTPLVSALSNLSNQCFAMGSSPAEDNSNTTSIDIVLLLCAAIDGINLKNQQIGDTAPTIFKLKFCFC